MSWPEQRNRQVLSATWINMCCLCGCKWINLMSDSYLLGWMGLKQNSLPIKQKNSTHWVHLLSCCSQNSKKLQNFFCFQGPVPKVSIYHASQLHLWLFPTAPGQPPAILKSCSSYRCFIEGSLVPSLSRLHYVRMATSSLINIPTPNRNFCDISDALQFCQKASVNHVTIFLKRKRVKRSFQ